MSTQSEALKALTADDIETIQSMVSHCINMGYRMGMHEGVRQDGTPRNQTKRMQAFADIEDAKSIKAALQENEGAEVDLNQFYKGDPNDQKITEYMKGRNDLVDELKTYQKSNVVILNKTPPEPQEGLYPSSGTTLDEIKMLTEPAQYVPEPKIGGTLSPERQKEVDDNNARQIEQFKQLLPNAEPAQGEDIREELEDRFKILYDPKLDDSVKKAMLYFWMKSDKELTRQPVDVEGLKAELSSISNDIGQFTNQFVEMEIDDDMQFICDSLENLSCLTTHHDIVEKAE